MSVMLIFFIALIAIAVIMLIFYFMDSKKTIQKLTEEIDTLKKQLDGEPVKEEKKETETETK